MGAIHIQSTKSEIKPSSNKFSDGAVFQSADIIHADYVGRVLSRTAGHKKRILVAQWNTSCGDRLC
ncbi:hypothetical protein DPMN_158639 [Dreissena polymorpha]|uniref:Uncharacterized protein n=1 Tax=Dreissena polymorpha TaxID=45954 RepID=A0A9D4IQ00_DREPO|nr:hypothetical protein DPMN_078983 [Dreissena polymorpha]KAH3780817.1 hypothetical protein DPMN_158639 [Dreissena polymorpha]